MFGVVINVVNLSATTPQGLVVPRAVSRFCVSVVRRAVPTYNVRLITFSSVFLFKKRLFISFLK